MALCVRAIRSAERLLSGRSGSDPSYERFKIPADVCATSVPQALPCLVSPPESKVRSHPCFRAFPDRPVCPHRTGRFSASASNPGAIPERAVSERAELHGRFELLSLGGKPRCLGKRDSNSDQGTVKGALRRRVVGDDERRPATASNARNPYFMRLFF